MLTSGIDLLNFKEKKKNLKIRKKLNKLLRNKDQVIKSLTSDYKDSFNSKKLINYKKFLNFRVIGMGGSILGTQAIYDFLNHKIKKKFKFIDNLQTSFIKQDNKKKYSNIIVSKSGNTIETIVNANIIINKKDQNIFITENKKSYLFELSQKLKAEIIYHNNFIGGRYSVLSEVGMLPAELLGLNEKKFKRFNKLIKNKIFINNLVKNVKCTLDFLKKGKFTSVILNYDERSDELFKWYQQLIAESLGKKSKGIMPVISSMPKDNHSQMQLYLDGPNKSFYTFFYVHDKKVIKINNDKILNSHNYLKNESINSISLYQKKATEKIFMRKKIPFRSFEILDRNEETMGELFCFFILETILLGMAMNINPFDQPSVELIKKATKKILI
jgi:glucose-6-phosphate isomerase